MPAIGFFTLKDKLLSGAKKQTIRPKMSDHWLNFKKGDEVVGYWHLRSWGAEQLFESRFSEDPFVIKWKDFTNELMKQDGFTDLAEGNERWFIPHYGINRKIVSEKEFVVLRWK